MGSKFTKISVAAGFLLLSQVASASPLTINFANIPTTSLAGGNIGAGPYQSSYTGPVTVRAWNSANGAAYGAANIFVRKQTPSDGGLGVCSSGEPNSACPAVGASFSGGGGDWNEISSENLANTEIIGLTLDTGWQWVSVQLASLDCNGHSSCTNSNEERYAMWYSSSANPGTPGTPGTSFTQGAATANSGSGVYPIIDLTSFGSSVVSANTLFIGPPSTGNYDHLVWQVTVEQTKVPEPGTTALLGLGLLGLGLRRRRVSA